MFCLDFQDAAENETGDALKEVKVTAAQPSIPPSPPPPQPTETHRKKLNAPQPFINNNERNFLRSYSVA